MIGRGSEWRRWEPHIHAPGTVLNNQFGGGSPWETYLDTLEAVTPKVEAIAEAWPGVFNRIAMVESPNRPPK